MPLTFLHYCAAYIVHKANRKLVLPALVVGSVIPDLEFLITTRGLMHSLFGAITLDMFIATLVTMLLYPIMGSWIFKLEKKSVKEKCQFSGLLVFSALVGSLSHVLIDSLHHEYNPLLYPFQTESFDALVLLNDWLLASTLVHVTLFSLLLVILLKEFNQKSEGFWRRILIG